MRAAPLVLLISACSFSAHPAAPADDDDDAPQPDAAVVAPPGDAPGEEAPPPLYAASNQMLHRLDLDAHTAMPVGAIDDGGTAIDPAGLAFDGTRLLALGPAGDTLLAIDPATAKVTSTRTLSQVGAWAGLTVIPAGELGANAVVLAGNTDDGQLYRISPADGAVTAVGAFGTGLRFFTDLAWVHGLGLIATLQGAGCTPVCFAKLDPATGAATIVRGNAPNTLYGLSGYRGTLWAFNANGPVLAVDPQTWLMSIAFDPEVHWTEAAQ